MNSINSGTSPAAARGKSAFSGARAASNPARARASHSPAAPAHALFSALAAALVLCVAPAAQAAEPAFPNRPIKLLVGSSAGGGGDTVARLVVTPMSRILGQPVVVENRPGAGGNIAAALVAKAPADGYNLLLAYTGHVVNPGLYRNLPFDTLKDLSGVTLLARNQTVLVVRPDIPAKDLASFLQLARAQPGKLTLAALPGTSQHLAGELMKSLAEVDLLTVPYKGSAPALTDVMGGSIDGMFSTVTLAAPYMRGGKLRALAVTGAERSSLHPELRTMAESGLPGLVSEGWYGIVAPSGVSTAVKDKLHAAFVAALADPTVRQALLAAGNEPSGLGPKPFDAFIRAEVPRWTAVIKRAGIEQQ